MAVDGVDGPQSIVGITTSEALGSIVLAFSEAQPADFLGNTTRRLSRAHMSWAHESSANQIWASHHAVTYWKLYW